MMTINTGKPDRTVSVDSIDRTKMTLAKSASSLILYAKETEEVVELSGDWKRDQYITGKKASEEDQRMFDVALTHENNAARLLRFLAKTFASSIAISTVVLLVTANNPNADKAFLKDTIPSLIDKQVTLLSGSIAGYLWTSRSHRSKPR